MTDTATERESGEDVINRLWERNYDPSSTAIIDGLPLQPSWRCLDLGAGTGSIARWLAHRVPAGSVVAVDTDTGKLLPGDAANLTVRAADVTTTDFPPGSFDLVFARALLSLLPEPRRLLDRAARWLAPGGWLLVEDFYFMPSDDAPTEVGRAVVDGYTKAFVAAGADMRMARKLPAWVAQAGLDEVRMTIRPLGPGQGAEETELMRARLRYQGQSLVDAGLVAADDLAAFVGSLDDPAARDVTTLGFAVWGRRPA